jgi:hypothetical protein
LPRLPFKLDLLGAPWQGFGVAEEECFDRLTVELHPHRGHTWGLVSIRPEAFAKRSWNDEKFAVNEPEWRFGKCTVTLLVVFGEVLASLETGRRIARAQP